MMGSNSKRLNGKHIFDWDENDVHRWLSDLGYPQYEREIREHNIRGDILCLLDADSLVSLGVKTVGQRLAILKSVYYLKVTHGVPLNGEDYIPPSLAFDDQVFLGDIHTNVRDQANRIRALEEKNRILAFSMQSFSNEIEKLRSAIGVSDETPKVTQKGAPFLQNEVNPGDRSTHSTEEDKQHADGSQTSSEQASASQTLPTLPAADTGTYPKLSLEDPTWKVLPAALRKHNVPRELWRDYAMFISYGPSGNRGKRRLDLDEKPLYLFKKLKEAGKNPAFVLKNLKEKDPHLSGSDSNNQPERKSSPTSPGIATQGQLSIYPSPPPSRSTPSPSIDPFQ